MYAGFWVFNNIIRPLRLGVSIAVGPQFDRVVESLQDRLRVNRGVAVAMVVVTANLLGTCLLMSLGILGAATLAGVPVFPSKT